eukprot:m.218531 g.218531  ORF g.218531 m.218531 type:complete len:53 (-) comp25711_c1_seq1:606-764(-)
MRDRDIFEYAVCDRVCVGQLAGSMGNSIDQLELDPFKKVSPKVSPLLLVTAE